MGRFRKRIAKYAKPAASYPGCRACTQDQEQENRQPDLTPVNGGSEVDGALLNNLLFEVLDNLDNNQISGMVELTGKVTRESCPE